MRLQPRAAAGRYTRAVAAAIPPRLTWRCSPCAPRCPTSPPLEHLPLPALPAPLAAWLTRNDAWLSPLAFVLLLPALWWLGARLAGHVNALLTRMAASKPWHLDPLLLDEIRRAIRRLLPLLSVLVAAPLLSAGVPALAAVGSRLTSVLLIAAVASLLLQAVNLTAAAVLRQYRLDVVDNLHARAVHTKVAMLKAVAIGLVCLIAVASMLMVFDSVRQVGTSLLASAGVAGIVLGFAAQRALATLLAGFQVALTQPIRMDDVVIVEGEWGRVEEITLTYVVVRVWDLRRIIVPITHFIEKPFQNWTRTSTDLLATVTLQVDYGVSLAALRAELSRILAASSLWDGKVNVLQVTDAKERALEIRALVSASNAGLAWDLRCEVREHLVAFLQRRYPESLPHLRVTTGEHRPAAAAAAGRARPSPADAVPGSPADGAGPATAATRPASHPDTRR